MGRFGCCCCLFWGHALQAPNNGNKSSAKRKRDGKLVNEGERDRERERERDIGQHCSVIVVVLFSLSSLSHSHRYHWLLQSTATTPSLAHTVPHLTSFSAHTHTERQKHINQFLESSCLTVRIFPIVPAYKKVPLHAWWTAATAATTFTTRPPSHTPPTLPAT